MEQLSDRVAVITGGASGIGLAMARRFAAEGMSIVLADIERGALDQAHDELRSDGAEVLAVATDVADPASVDALATATLERFGGVNLVCANAGVGSRGLPIAELPLADFQWLLGVNLFGVIHTIHSFLPLLEAADEGHVVATSSIAGLMHPQGMGPYNASKAAVLALTETLRFELAERSPHIGVSALCPGWVRTNLGSADRNRPERYSWETTSDQAAQIEARRRFIADVFERGGIEADQVAELVFEAVRANRFYVLTHPDMTHEAAARFDRIVSGRNPEPPVL